MSIFMFSRKKRVSPLQNVGESTEHFPEVILNNFNTRLGHTIARMFASLFPYDPMFKGRRVVTFHNQRDYIFFRHHRYSLCFDLSKKDLDIFLHFLLPLLLSSLQI